MKIIVQKFGGTSVATEEARMRIVSRVADAKDRGYSPVVVVSAMGRAGDPYATDTLISLAKAASVEPSPRELDLLMSCGEIISTVVVTSTLRTAGIDSFALTGGQAGIITDDNYNNSQIMKVETRKIVGKLAEGKVVVVAGFQGMTESGDVTTLGRGGSDTTAAAIGAALDAETVEIYTDVDGVKTADPRLVPEARTIEHLTYEEICQMAHEGARVIHPRAVEIAMRHNIPIRVRSTFNDLPGTLVAVGQGMLFWPEARHLHVVTGVTHIAGLCQVALVDGREEPLPYTGTFRRLADSGISVDMISVTPKTCSFVVKEDLSERTLRILDGLGLKPRILHDCAKVSVVGSGMRGLPGVMANVSEALSGAGVEILQTSDSHVTISCLVRRPDLEKAAQALHARFALDAPRDRGGIQ